MAADAITMTKGDLGHISVSPSRVKRKFPHSQIKVHSTEHGRIEN
jgi:hypothetical protein